MYATDLLAETVQSWPPPRVLVMCRVQKSAAVHPAVAVEWDICLDSTQPATNPYSTRLTARSTSLLEFAPATKQIHGVMPRGITYTQTVTVMAIFNVLTLAKCLQENP